MSTGDSFSEAAFTGDPDDSDPDYEIGDRLETIDEYKPPSKTRKRIKKERFVYYLPFNPLIKQHSQHDTGNNRSRD